MKKVLYIPLKLESERVPGKNYRLLNGKPLYKYLFNTLDRCEKFDEIYIDFDSKEIKEIVELPSGFKSYIRPDYLRENSIGSNELLAYFVNHVVPYECWVFQVHVTSPFITCSTLHKFVTISSHQEVESIFCVRRLQERFYRSNGEPINHDPLVLVRTQDLEPVFVDASLIYAFRRSFFLREGSRISKESKQILVESSKELIDIDTEEDWTLAVYYSNL